MAQVATQPLERYPRSLIAADTRVLLGFGIRTIQKPPQSFRNGECDVLVAGHEVRTLAIFELEHPTVSTMREIYVACVSRNTVREIQTLEAFERAEIVGRVGGPARRARRVPEPDYRFRLVNLDDPYRRSLVRSARGAPNGSDSQLAMAALMPLSEPLVCSLRLFVLADGSPLITLIDDQLDRLVLAIGNVGDRIEWRPKSPASYKPPWFEQTLAGFETTEVP